MGTLQQLSGYALYNMMCSMYVYVCVYQVRWSRQLYHNNLVSPNILRLASVDATSQCFVWDAGQATPICNFSLGSRPIVDVQWLFTNVSMYIV